jgi:hypothetical protein
MGAAKRTQSLVWAITTAGVDMAGICYEVRGGVVKMLDGAVERAALRHHLHDRRGRRLAASSRAGSRRTPTGTRRSIIDLFRMDATEAIQTASKENNFKTKHLNIWCNADVAWMQMSAWDGARCPSSQEADFEASPASLGSTSRRRSTSRRARSSSSATGPSGRRETGEPKTSGTSTSSCEVLPARGTRSRRARIRSTSGLGERGPDHHATPGNVLDFEAVKADLRADARRTTCARWPSTRGRPSSSRTR